MFGFRKGLVLSALLLCQQGYGKDFHFPREDGSTIDYYLQEPSKTSYPIVVVIQDTDCKSVKGEFEKTSSQLANYVDSAIVSVEKRGLKAGDEKCGSEYLQHNSIQSRLSDLQSVVTHLKSSLPNWDRRVAYAGLGEGGILAAMLSKADSDAVATVIFGAGGGYSRADDLRLMQKKSGSVCDILTPHKLDAQLNEIQHSPTSIKTWCDPTFTYQWWASILDLKPADVFLQLSTPIYMAHGALDVERPIEGADAVANLFRAAGKTNLTYERYSDLDHLWKTQDGSSHAISVTLKVISWMRDVFKNNSFVDNSSDELALQEALEGFFDSENNN